MLPRRLTLLKRFYSGQVVRSPFSEITIPDITIDQLVWQNFSKWEDKTAIECGKTGIQWTYKELRRKCEYLASNLSSLKLSGKTVLMVMGNCPEYAAAVLGSLEAGMTVSTANPLYKSGEITHQANDSKAKLVITAPEYLETVCSAKLGVPIICTGELQQDGIHSFNQMTNNKRSTVTPKAEQRLKDLALLPYSSGTTGLPKGVKLNHRNLVANILQFSHPDINFIKEASGNHQDVVPAVLPFFHSYGLTVIMLRGFSMGAKLVTLPKFDPPAFLNILRSNKEIVLHAVPPIISFLACRPEVKPEYLEGLRHTMTAAAPCSLDDLEKLNEKKPHSILQGYGLTESSPGLTLSTEMSTNKSTIGYPLPNTVGCIVEPNTDKLLPPGIHGEIWFKGPQVMEGYQNRPEATAETLDSNGWLHTGDIGYTDEQGQFYIVDRIKELIKVKGYQVAPAELEHLLRTYPLVEDAGVIGVPSIKKGEVPIAYIVPKPGMIVEEDKILEWLGKRVAHYKKPERIISITEIPKTQSGKILRRNLKDMAKNLKLE